MQCPNCKMELTTPNSSFCPNCGERLSEETSRPAQEVAGTPQPSPEAEAFQVAPAAEVPPVQDASERAKKKQTGLLAGGIGGGLLLITLAVLLIVILPAQRRLKQYNEGVELIDQKQFAKAAECFGKLGDYEDAKQLADYASGRDAFDRGNYRQAEETFLRLGDFLDAPVRLVGARQELLYENAKQNMERGNYTEALSALEQIPDLKEATTLAHQCRDRIAYAEAQALFSSEAYEEALIQLDGIDDLPEAETLRQNCLDILTYRDAMEKYTMGAYAEAAELFAKVPHIENSTALLAECKQKAHHEKIQVALDSRSWADALALLNEDLGQDYPNRNEVVSSCQTHLKYEQAEKALSDGNNYTAFMLFTALGDFEDAATRAKACSVSRPANGETYRNSSYAQRDCQQQIRTPNDGIYTYMKIYAKQGDREELVSCIFIHPGKSVSIYLPAGKYIYKVAYGSGDWYGEKEMFGDEGDYQRVGGSSFVFEREKLKNQYYELKLRVSKGNTGSAKEKRDGF